MLTYFIVILICLYIWGFHIEPNLLTVKKYKVENLDGKRIVFVSDFHTGKYEKQRLQRIINKINKLKPDLVLSGGDFIKGYSGRNTMPIKEQAEEFAKIKAPIITVLGNHDIKYDKFTIKEELEKSGMTVLDNSSTEFGNLHISGVGNKIVTEEEIASALKDTTTRTILISHTPDIYYDVKEKIDLILAGHVHGGQVRIPFIGAIICPSKYGNKFSCGEILETQNRMIITKGLGTSILNVRFFDIPEIVLLEE